MHYGNSHEAFKMVLSQSPGAAINRVFDCGGKSGFMSKVGVWLQIENLPYIFFIFRVL